MLKHPPPYTYYVCKESLKKRNFTAEEGKNVQQQEQKLTNPTSAIRPTKFTRARVQQPHTCPMYNFIHTVLFRLPATPPNRPLLCIYDVCTVLTMYIKCVGIQYPSKLPWQLC